MAGFFDQALRKPVLAYVPAWVHPNWFSILRGILVAPVVLLRSVPPLAVGFLILSSCCDILDGVVARIRGQTSQWGAFLDAASDKVFVLGTLFFACDDRVPILISFSVLGLEVALVAIRPLKRVLGAKNDSNILGKVKIWVQSFAIAFVLTTNSVLYFASYFVFALAILLALGSLFFHLRDIRNRKVA